MGNCNCKVNQQITYLEKKYGHNMPVSKKTTIRLTVKEFFISLFTFLIGIIFLPLIILHIIFISIFTKDKKISIKKLLRLQHANG